MFQFKFCILHLIAEKDYSGTVLTRVFFFYKKMYGRFAGRPNKSGRNNEVTVLPTEVAIRQQGVSLSVLAGQLISSSHKFIKCHLVHAHGTHS